MQTFVNNLLHIDIMTCRKIILCTGVLYVLVLEKIRLETSILFCFGKNQGMLSFSLMNANSEKFRVSVVNVTCIDFQIFGHFGNLVNSLKGSGGEHMKFLTFGTPLNKMKHPNI